MLANLFKSFFGGVNFVVKKKKSIIKQVKLWSIQSFCWWQLLMLMSFFFSSFKSALQSSRFLEDSGEFHH